MIPDRDNREQLVVYTSGGVVQLFYKLLEKTYIVVVKIHYTEVFLFLLLGVGRTQYFCYERLC